MESLTVRKQMVRKALLSFMLGGAVFLSACAKSGSFKSMASQQESPAPQVESHPQGPVTPGGPVLSGPGKEPVEAGGEAPPTVAGPTGPAVKPETPAPVDGPRGPTPDAPVEPGSAVPQPPVKPGPAVAPPVAEPEERPAKPDVKPETKPDAKPEPKPETQTPTPKPDVTEPAKPQPKPEAPAKRPALPWESLFSSEKKKWSAHVYALVEREFARLDLANDMDRFCPRYEQLDKENRIIAWAFLITQVVKHESSWNPLSRMKEDELGTDSITGQPVYSEGLMQLSYQDTKWAPFCEFDWDADKALGVTSPKKTILDPYKNLTCGVGILARQVQNRRLIALKERVYWAVLRDGGRYSRIPHMVRDMPRLLKACAK